MLCPRARINRLSYSHTSRQSVPDCTRRRRLCEGWSSSLNSVARQFKRPVSSARPDAAARQSAGPRTASGPRVSPPARPAKGDFLMRSRSSRGLKAWSGNRPRPVPGRARGRSPRLGVSMMMGTLAVPARAAAFCKLKAVHFRQHHVSTIKSGVCDRAFFSASAPTPPFITAIARPLEVELQNEFNRLVRHPPPIFAGFTLGCISRAPSSHNFRWVNNPVTMGDENAGARVSHPQQPGLRMSARNSTNFWIVERAAVETTALRRPKNDLGNTAIRTRPRSHPLRFSSFVPARNFARLVPWSLPVISIAQCANGNVPRGKPARPRPKSSIAWAEKSRNARCNSAARRRDF